MNKKQKEWLKCLKSIVISSLATLGVFLIGSIVIYAVLAEIKIKIIRELVLFVMMMVMYAVFLYRFHMYDRLSTYAEHTNEFGIKKELIAYIHSEGKIMFVLYGIAALVTEFSELFLHNMTPNPILFSTMFCLGPWMSMEIPILRAVIAFVYSGAIVTFLAVLRSRKIHQQEIQSKKR